jgi:site-specific DNA recombinase
MTIHFLLRRSKDKGQEHSLDRQRAGCEAYRVELGFKGKVVEHMSDGIAGDDVKSLVAVTGMLEQLRPGDVVVCRDNDRIGRKIWFVTMVIETIAEKGARLFYYGPRKEIFSRDAADQMANATASHASQSEVEKIRARTKEALRSLVKAGKVAGGICYGYRLEELPDETKVALIHDEQAAIVRRIVDEYLAGDGYKTIAIQLNNEHVPSPFAKAKHGKGRGTGSWSPGQIRDMLRNERYAGWYVHGRIKRKKEGKKRVATKADPSEIIRVEIPEWRIIDEITWARVQAVMGKRSHATDPSKGRATYQLTGIVRCGLCGGPIGVVNTKVAGGARVSAYGCYWRHTRGPSVCENTMRRPTSIVEDAMADAIKVAIERPDVVAVLMTAVRLEVEKQAAEAASVDTGTLEADLVEAKRQHRNLVRVLATIDDEDDGLTAEIKVLGARVRQLETSLAVVTRAPAEAAAYIAQAEATVRSQLARIGAVLKASPEMTRDFYREFLEGMTMTPGRNDERPRRVIVEGAVRLVQAEVTPPGIEPGIET